MILFSSRLTSVFSIILFLVLSLPGFSKPKARITEPLKATKAAGTTVLRGRASWYGREFQGRRTTSGERFNRLAYTCAHKTLPFGTRLRVTNVKNGKSVVVRVSDRGPFRHQRILDLAEVAARPLGIVNCGAATVVAEVVDDETPLGPATAPENLAALYAADPHPTAAYATYTLPAEPTETTEVVEVATEQTAPDTVASTTCPVGFLVQAGSFIDSTNAQTLQARIQLLDPKLQVELSEDLLDGRQRTRVLVGNFGERPEAEAVRRRLQLWGIGGLVREVALR